MATNFTKLLEEGLSTARNEIKHTINIIEEEERTKYLKQTWVKKLMDKISKLNKDKQLIANQITKLEWEINSQDRSATEAEKMEVWISKY